MARIIFVSSEGKRTELEARPGISVMVAAVTNGVDEIVAECGGSLACGTCHVYVEPSQLPLISPMSAAEDEMLNGTASERRFNSRLSCQIAVSDALDGLVLHLPPCQA
ncbi:MAG: 2Fe-2S iron-sulfur cluster-binding protein [Roseiarcus sp.]